jgi:hypothetical protein
MFIRFFLFAIDMFSVVVLAGFFWALWLALP